MFVIRNGCPVTIDNDSAERSNCPPPDSYDLATLMGETKLQARIPVPLSPAAERRPYLSRAFQGAIFWPAHRLHSLRRSATPELPLFHQSITLNRITGNLQEGGSLSSSGHE